jgi:hypothetical protein
MSRTWLVRGIVVGIVAVLSCAWAVTVAGVGDSGSPAAERTTPASPDSSKAPEPQRSVVVEKLKPRRANKPTRSRDAGTDPSPDATDEPADDAPTTPPPTSGHPTQDPPDPSDDPTDSPPPPDPSDPPSEPSDECTDLASVIDCVLNPITAQP